MREQHLADFLKQNQLDAAKRQALAGDASSRRYERISDVARSVILMDAPPPENVGPFIEVAALLKAQGYSPPEIIAADLSRGFLLLEDLGDTLFARLIDAGAEEAPLYQLAADFLIDLTRRSPPSGLPRFSDDYISEQNELFLDWYIPDQSGASVSPRDRQMYRDIWSRLLPKIRVGPDVILLRDFHAENLLYLEGREGLKALGVLDFQDALVGPPAYDLASLLQDARRDVGVETAEQMIRRYIEQTNVEENAFRSSYAILGAHRALRIMGIFVRLAKAQGKTRYLDMLPRMRRHLAHNLAHPELGELEGWLQKTLGDIGQ
ncbi:MAG: aminoglycoside phosphotransferase [Sneathiella sp.]|nr:MAG: aminoglycoside phosphotransferase [Sneathiella sp.]